MKVRTDIARRVFALLFVVVSVTGLALATSGAASASTPGTFIYKSNVSGSHCLDVTAEDGVTAVGARIQLYHCTGAAEQHFTISDTGLKAVDGSPFYRFQSGRSGLCIAPSNDVVASGVQIKQEICDGSKSAQLWRITGGRLQPHLVINALGNFVCLDDLGNSNADHNRIQLHFCTGGDSQLWHQAGEGPLT
jgi:hypothetical protein